MQRASSEKKNRRSGKRKKTKQEENIVNGKPNSGDEGTKSRLVKRGASRIVKEKMARERSDLLRKAGLMLVPPPLPHPDDIIIIMPGSIKPASVKAGGIKVTGCVDIFDDDPYAELDDDDFEWDSDMDGEISSSLSEDEKDYHADDPWHALLVLGLRVYSQSSPVTIKVREGDETDDDEPAPGKPDSDVRLDGRNTSVDEDNTKQPSASSEAIYTPGKDDQSNSMTKTLHEHDSISSIEKPSDITIEQKK